MAKKDKGWRFVLPAIIALAIVAFFPFIFSVYISLTNSTAYSIYNGKFVFLKNYIDLFRDIKFYDSIKVTVLYVLLSVFIETVLGFLIAILIDSLPKHKRIFMVLMIVPMMIAPLVYGIIFKLAYNSIYGIIPQIFRQAFGFEPNLLNKPMNALLSMVVVDVFQWTSFVFLIIYSALQSLPIEPFEAALLDGATFWKRIRYITFPMIKPAIGIAVALRMIDAFKTFDQVFVITGGGPGTATTTMSLYTYFLMFTRYNFGSAAALTILILIAATIATKFVFKALYRKAT